MGASSEKLWIYRRNELESEPVTSEQLRQLATERVIGPETFVRWNEGTRWRRAGEMKGLSFPPPDGGVAAGPGSQADDDQRSNRAAAASASGNLQPPLADRVDYAKSTTWQVLAGLGRRFPSRAAVIETARPIVQNTYAYVTYFLSVPYGKYVVGVVALVATLSVGYVLGRSGASQPTDAKRVVAADKKPEQQAAINQGSAEPSPGPGLLSSLFGRTSVAERTDVSWPQIVNVPDGEDWADQYRNARLIHTATLWKDRPPLRVIIDADVGIMSRTPLADLRNAAIQELEKLGVQCDQASPATATIRLRSSQGKKQSTQGGRVVKSYTVTTFATSILVGADLPLLRGDRFITSNVGLLYATASDCFAGNYSDAENMTVLMKTVIDHFSTGDKQSVPIDGPVLADHWPTDVTASMKPNYYKCAEGVRVGPHPIASIAGCRPPEVTFDKTFKAFKQNHVLDQWESLTARVGLPLDPAARTWVTHDVQTFEGYLNQTQRSIVRLFSSVPNYRGINHLIVIREPVVFQYRGQMVWTNGAIELESTTAVCLPDETTATLRGTCEKAVSKVMLLR